MTRILCTLFVLSLTGCAGEFATQCDGITDKGEQLACLDAGFQSLRADQATCRGEDIRDREGDCYDRCVDDRGDDECRRACYEADDEGRTRDGDDRDTRARRGRDGDERERLDRLHLDTRDDVDRAERTGERARHIRDGLRDGEELARCER